jgi:hypothetical protein
MPCAPPSFTLMASHLWVTAARCPHPLACPRAPGSNRPLFTVSDFEGIADALSPGKWLSPHKSLFSLGNYDVNVLTMALQSRGLAIRWHDARLDTRTVHVTMPECVFGGVVGAVVVAVVVVVVVVWLWLWLLLLPVLLSVCFCRGCAGLYECAARTICMLVSVA